MFKANGWTWCDGVPSKLQIEGLADSLAYQALNEVDPPPNSGKTPKDHSCTGSGRLQVRFNLYASGWIASLELVPVTKRS